MSRLKDLPPGVARVLWLGATLFWAVQLSLYLLGGLSLLDTILLATLLIAIPALAIAQVPLAQEALIERLPAYWSSIATLWVLGTISWLVGTRTEGLAAIGLTLLPPVPFIAWTLGLTAAGLGIIVVFRQVALGLRVRESPLLRSLLPRTAEERGVFAILSLAAGVGEEVAYRGYAIPVLIPVVGSVGALLLTSRCVRRVTRLSGHARNLSHGRDGRDARRWLPPLGLAAAGDNRTHSNRPFGGHPDRG